MTTLQVRAPHAADWALAHGRSALTVDDLADLLAVPTDQVRRRLQAPADRGEWVQPARGLWLPVPPEFRPWGAPPGIDVVDHVARHLGVDYYVGWLSAAALHGVAHQAPQVFQVATSSPVRDRVVGRTRFEFHTRDIEGVSTVDRDTRSGSARVSTVAATMLDIASDPRIAGGIDNVATVLVELSETDGFQVADLVALRGAFRVVALRRVGWILEQFGEIDDLEGLRSAALGGPQTPSRLDPTRDLVGTLEPRWRLRLNRDVEPDL